MQGGNTQITCWTRWIRENRKQLKILNSLPHQHLKMRDSRFRYSLVHALMAGDIEESVVIQCFNVLRKNSLISLITAKDKEGDTPLHSAIRSGTKPELIKLLMNAISGMKTKRRLLIEPNKRGELPIVNAFNLRRWPIVEVLLEECIKCHLLPELTGVGGDVASSKRKTLLLKAMKRGFIRYLKIYLEVCRKCINAVPVKAMLVPDKTGHTPWYYFLSLDEDLIKEGLGYLKEYEVDINKLLCDHTGRTSLLHEAFRRDNHEVCKLLLEYGANEDQLDAHNLSPPQRKRVLSLQYSSPTSPVHRSSLVVERPVRVDVESQRSNNEGVDLSRNDNIEVNNQTPVPASRANETTVTTENSEGSDELTVRGTPSQGNLLDALDLELPSWQRSLSPRQHEAQDDSTVLHVSIRKQRRVRLPYNWYKQSVVVVTCDGHRLFLKWCSPTPSFFSQVSDRDQLEATEPQLCPIHDVNSNKYFASFTTYSPAPH